MPHELVQLVEAHLQIRRFDDLVLATYSSLNTCMAFVMPINAAVDSRRG